MGQDSGEYWSQGAKVMGKAQDKPIITMMGLGGSVFLFRLLSLSFCLFILSQHFILGQFRDSVIFVSMGGDSCIPMSFFLLLFLCHFLSFCLHLCSLPFLSSPYISLSWRSQSGGVGFWLALSFMCIITFNPSPFLL